MEYPHTQGKTSSVVLVRRGSSMKAPGDCHCLHPTDRPANNVTAIRGIRIVARSGQARGHDPRLAEQERGAQEWKLRTAISIGHRAEPSRAESSGAESSRSTFIEEEMKSDRGLDASRRSAASFRLRRASVALFF